MGIEFRALRSDDYRKLTEFFLSLSDQTIGWQNHFGKVNDLPRAQIIALEETKKPTSQYAAISVEFGLTDVIVAYGWLDLGNKLEQRFTCSLGLVVTDSFQGKGIGKQLCEYMISEARKLGMRKIWLLCYTDNARAFQLYRKLGFTVEGLFQKQEYTKEDKPRDLFSLALFL